MNLKNNFQRHLILDFLLLFNNLCLATISIILKYYYNISLLHFLIIGILFSLYFKFFYMDYSKNIFKKYCNKECDNCNMWHCDLYYKNIEK